MKQIEKDCYALLQAVVLKRDVYCRAPGCTNRSTAAHHIFGRGNHSTAFDPKYSLGLCLDWHVPWAHLAPGQFTEWCMFWMGVNEYFTARRLSRTVVKHQD